MGNSETGRRPSVPRKNPIQSTGLRTTLPRSDEHSVETWSRIFGEFLNANNRQNKYARDMDTMLRYGARRLIVNIDDIRGHQRSAATELISKPSTATVAFDEALRRCIEDRTGIPTSDPYHVGYTGNLGRNHVRPVDLCARQLGQMVCVDAIVTSMSGVRPKLVRSAHYCEQTQQFWEQEFFDDTSALARQAPTSTVYPTMDPNGNKLVTEFGMCDFRDHQIIRVQEMPEMAGTRQIPRSIEVYLEDDLVDSCKPGDRVQIVGVYRSLGGTNPSSGKSVFRCLILANNVRQFSKDRNAPQITDVDVENIKKVARLPDVFEILGRSLAPSVHGHHYIKKAMLLMMLGGAEKKLKGGTKTRGDINILLLGDPATAKSQMLRFVLNMVPLGVAATGKGSSGVGLTAAVVQDRDSRERRLEAGAMVLADRGVVCIDEFDKMSDIDRVAIHEVMEQQTVTIAKAGIHTTLNARCSVLAAANPAYDRYDDSLDPHKNIGLPDSLLSRFDLLFILKDELDPRTDSRLAFHCAALHRRPDGVHVSRPTDEAGGRNLFYREEDETERAFRSAQRNEDVSILNDGTLSHEFLRKYICYAKERINPILSAAAKRVIVDRYVDLRNAELDDGQRRTLPVTARTLETLIRLAHAHAKARLSLQVEEDDALAAEDLVRFSLFREMRRKRRKRAKKETKRQSQRGIFADSDSGSEESESDGSGRRVLRRVTRSNVQMVERDNPRAETPRNDNRSEAGDDEEVPMFHQLDRSLASPLKRIAGQRAADSKENVEWVRNMGQRIESSTATGSGKSEKSAQEVQEMQRKDEKYQSFRRLLHDAFEESFSTTLETERIEQVLNSKADASMSYSQEETKEFLERMEQEDLLFLTGDLVIRL